ncbi:MAG: tRNA (adenosine(37)-N6)-threonylcarbamoyltransferase complex ATPase subunit type 1 TsaE [Clostridia bacterium]|nr:tRNA (adenosine(37)-N6)-threonylcarbamoyltransferase complex ATPase subunit type 1 TsaE [Clostridia bacterium]MBR6523981.1 tRNA (adenosine(37)-N6)-threonylcarbamoyltransferase complex ATPase subunit type 1 TsaE [Clostridia bacterium]
MKMLESRSAAETSQIAKEFAKTLKPGDIVALSGDLGAGKTAFTKGVAEFFGIPADEVGSPTFTMVNQYDGDLTIYHFDAYRLENVGADSCDWMDDYFFGDGICLIEWAQNIKDVLPKGYIEVKLDKAPEKGDDYRAITIIN